MVGRGAGLFVALGTSTHDAPMHRRGSQLAPKYISDPIWKMVRSSEYSLNSPGVDTRFITASTSIIIVVQHDHSRCVVSSTAVQAYFISRTILNSKTAAIYGRTTAFCTTAQPSPPPTTSVVGVSGLAPYALLSTPQRLVAYRVRRLSHDLTC